MHFSSSEFFLLSLVFFFFLLAELGGFSGSDLKKSGNYYVKLE